MFSFGVILYIILGGYPPFEGNSDTETYRNTTNGLYEFHPKYWHGVSDAAKDLIRGLLVLSPADRLTAKQALAHPWLHTEDSELAKRSLTAQLANFQKYMLKKKFRGGVKAVVASNRFCNLLKSRKTLSEEAEREGGEAVIKDDNGNTGKEDKREETEVTAKEKTISAAITVERTEI
jgi:serine/threonine protein kinase